MTIRKKGACILKIIYATKPSGSQSLYSREEIGDWYRSEGHVERYEILRRRLQDVSPDLEIINTKFDPCIIAETPTGYPYIDMVENNVAIVTGCNGKSAKSSDEIGRLAANLLNDGAWDETLPAEIFKVMYAS